MSAPARTLPAHLHDAHEWTDAAGELRTLAGLTDGALDAYVIESAANAREYALDGEWQGADITENGLRELAAWLRGGW